MIKVLIVDDSPTTAKYLAEIFTSDPDFSVIGIAHDGIEGIRMAGEMRPDIISMDFNMPDLNGIAATRKIMSTCPTPIVIVSSLYDKYAIAMSFKSLEAGALAILPTPPSRISPEFPQRKQELLKTFKAMAEVKVIRRIAPAPALFPTASAMASGAMPVVSAKEIRLIAIGASTGGPQVIHDILSHLPTSFWVPIVIVQHITPGFEEGLATWLDQTTGFSVSVAANNESLKDRHVYLAPQGVHLEVTSNKSILLVPGPPVHCACPSISRFFCSVARTYGSAAIGVILTGMGTDGAAELKMMRNEGATTIAQDRESSIVHGMPGEAIKLDGACHILPGHSIAAMICSFIPSGIK